MSEVLNLTSYHCTVSNALQYLTLTINTVNCIMSKSIILRNDHFTLPSNYSPSVVDSEVEIFQGAHTSFAESSPVTSCQNHAYWAWSLH